MASVFWDSEGVINVNVLPPHATIKAQCYNILLLNDVHAAIHKIKPGKLPEETPAA
jgi:hypothetical protein